MNNLRRRRCPRDFKYLAVIESGLENVRSPKGAKGFWQLMPGTAKEYGLEVNSNVDERYHIEKSTRVACKYLLKGKRTFGSLDSCCSIISIEGCMELIDLLDKQLVEDYYDFLVKYRNQSLCFSDY